MRLRFSTSVARTTSARTSAKEVRGAPGKLGAPFLAMSNRVQMVAERPFTYDGKRLKKGDTFGALKHDAPFLQAYRQASLKVECGTVEEEISRPKRRYRRRDMQAEQA